MTASLKRVVKISHYVYLHLQGESFEFLTLYIYVCKVIYDYLLVESRLNLSLCIFTFAS